MGWFGLIFTVVFLTMCLLAYTVWFLACGLVVNLEAKEMGSKYTRLAIERQLEELMLYDQFRPVYLVDWNHTFDNASTIYLNSLTLKRRGDKYYCYSVASNVFPNANELFQFIPDHAKSKLRNDTTGVYIF